MSGQVASFGLRIIQGVVLARLLSERDFGIIALSMVLLEFTTLIQGMGLQIAALQKGAEREGVVETAFTIQLGLALIRSLFMMLLVAPMWSALFREPALTAVVRIQALMLLINATAFIPRVMLQARLRFGLISSSLVAGNILAALVSMGIAWKIQSYWAVVIGYFFGNLLTLTLMLVFSRERWVFGIRSALAGELTRFGLRVLVLHLVALSGYQLDKVVLGAILSMDDVGVYWQAYKWGMLGVIALIPAVQPVFFAAYCHRKEQVEKLRAAYLQSITASSLLLIPAALGLVVVAPDFVVAFLGAKWEPAVRPMQWLAIISLPRMLNSLTAPLIQAVGRPELQLRAELWSKLVFVAALLMLCGRFGITGVVMAVAINHVVSQVLMNRSTRELVGAGLGHCLRAMAWPAVLSLVILPVVWLAGFIADPLVRCIVAVVGATLAFGATVLIRYRVRSVSEARRLLTGEAPL
jgi:O-antigen/teichoic acid export membrane protein